MRSQPLYFEVVLLLLLLLLWLWFLLLLRKLLSETPWCCRCCYCFCCCCCYCCYHYCCLYCVWSLSKLQPNLNTRVGFYGKITLHYHHLQPHPPPTTETQCQQYFSCYWPNFDKILNVGSCEHLEQIPTVRVTFVLTTFVLTTYVHIRNISAVTDPILMKLYRLVPGNI